MLNKGENPPAPRQSRPPATGRCAKSNVLSVIMAPIGKAFAEAMANLQTTQKQEKQ